MYLIIVSAAEMSNRMEKKGRDSGGISPNFSGNVLALWMDFAYHE